MSNNVRQPTDAEVEAWWNFALKFQKGPNSAFKIGIGSDFPEITDSYQPQNLYCLTCTAGNGGKDPQRRTLDKSTAANRDIFVPVFVSIGENENIADACLGNPEIIFEIEENSGQVDRPTAFRFDKPDITVSVPQNNEFDIPQEGKTQQVVTRNYCAVIPNDKIANIKSITFGGSGGRTSAQNQANFVTEVTYEVTE
jgi:hypothetical protein